MLWVDEPNLAKDPPPSLMIRPTLSIIFLGLSPTSGRRQTNFQFSSHGTRFRKNSEILLRVNRCASSTPIGRAGSIKIFPFLSFEFVHYAPLSLKTPLRSFLLIRTLPRHCAVSVPGSSIAVDLMVGHLRAASREPRKIEILGQTR
jgi:hypothetical protein